MSQPRPWPNNAKEDRDRAAEAAQSGINALEAVINNEKLSEVERIRQEARALDRLQTIARLLESMGAQTKEKFYVFTTCIRPLGNSDEPARASQ